MCGAASAPFILRVIGPAIYCGIRPAQRSFPMTSSCLSCSGNRGISASTFSNHSEQNYMYIIVLLPRMLWRLHFHFILTNSYSSSRKFVFCKRKTGHVVSNCKKCKYICWPKLRDECQVLAVSNSSQANFLKVSV